MNFTRQLNLLDPEQIKDKSITVIGVGATGSYVASLLAQMGWGDSTHSQGRLRVFDGDIVEEHNLANQIYEPDHIGKPKVEALKQMILKKCGFEIEAYNQMVDDKTDSELIRSTYVFMLTDTMKSRTEIFEKHLKFPFNTDLLVETRMGLRDGRIYSFNPNNNAHVEDWKKTLYSDNVAEASLCGGSQSIVSTVGFLASLAVGRILQHFNMKYGNDNIRPDKNQPYIQWNEAQFSLYPETFYLRCFGEEPVLAMCS
jgi:molybdopterin/thiamine biosynthesis adenylyltransferase